MRVASEEQGGAQREESCHGFPSSEFSRLGSKTSEEISAKVLFGARVL